MKKIFLFLLLAVSFIANAQRILLVNGKKQPIPPGPTKIAQVAMTQKDNLASPLTGWNAAPRNNTSFSLLDPSGAALGWTLSYNADITDMGDGVTDASVGPVDPIFPQQAMYIYWAGYLTNNDFIITIGGLNTGKTYDIKVGVTIGSDPTMTQDITVDGTTVTLTATSGAGVATAAFSGAAPDGSGNLTIKLTYTADLFFQINAFTIKEN